MANRPKPGFVKMGIQYATAWLPGRGEFYGRSLITMMVGCVAAMLQTVVVLICHCFESVPNRTLGSHGAGMDVPRRKARGSHWWLDATINHCNTCQPFINHYLTLHQLALPYKTRLNSQGCEGIVGGYAPCPSKGLEEFPMKKLGFRADLAADWDWDIVAKIRVANLVLNQEALTIVLTMLCHTLQPWASENHGGQMQLQSYMRAFEISIDLDTVNRPNVGDHYSIGRSIYLQNSCFPPSSRRVFAIRPFVKCESFRESFSFDPEFFGFQKAKEILNLF